MVLPPWHLLGPVLTLGFLHGFSPEHGWPLAISFALKKERRILSGAIGGLLLGLGHLLSSIVVVLLFLSLGRYLHPTTRLLEILAGVLLVALGIKEFLHKHHHSHDPAVHDPDRLSQGKGGFAALLLFAILLGFAHEEEFQILGICAGELNHCFSLMIFYALSVILSLTLTTILILLSPRLLPLKRIEPVLPWLTGFLLLLTGIRFLVK